MSWIGAAGLSGLCLADLTILSQTRTITVTTMADGQSAVQSAPDFAPFVATVTRSVPAVVEGVQGLNAGTTDISCHFDRNAIAARARMLALGVVGQTTQVTAITTTQVDVTFVNDAPTMYRLSLAGSDVAAVGLNDVLIRFSSLDGGGVLFEQQASNVGGNSFARMEAGRYRFEFLATQTSAVGECGREYEVELTAPAMPCDTDVDDGSFTGTPDLGVTIDDLLYYLYIFGAGDVAADLDDGSGRGHRDHAVTIDDLLYFLQRFQDGC